MSSSAGWLAPGGLERAGTRGLSPPSPSLVPSSPSPGPSPSLVEAPPFFSTNEKEKRERREAGRAAFEEAKALYEAGVEVARGNPRAATLHFRQAAAVFSTLSSSKHLKRRDKALWQAGMCFAREGVRVGRRAARFARKGGGRGGEGRKRAEEGLEEARGCLEQARDLFHFLGETSKEAIALYQLGLFSTTIAEAADHFKSAAIFFAECGDEGREAMCYAELGNLFAAGEAGDPDSGIWFFKQALLLYLKLGDTLKEAHCLFSCGVLFARLPSPDPSAPSSTTSSPSLGASIPSSTSHHTPNPTQSALAYLSQSATLFRKMKDRKGEAECRYQMGKIYARVGGAREKSGLERAVKEFEEASNLFLKAGSNTDCAWTYYRLSLVMLKVRSKELALDYLAEARKLFADAKEKKAEGACLVRMAEMMRAEESAEVSAPGSKEKEEAVVADKYLEEAATLMPSSTFDRLTRSHSRSSAHIGRRGTIRLSASSPQLSSTSPSQSRPPPRLRTASSPDDLSHGLEIVREEDEEDEEADEQEGHSLARQGSEGGLGLGAGRDGEAWWAVKDDAGIGEGDPSSRVEKERGKERERRRSRKASAGGSA